MIKHPDIYPILKDIGLPVFIQGEMPEEMPYPDTFITYLWFRSEDIWRFDNMATATNYTCQVTIYSRLPNEMDNAVSKVIEALTANGYSKDGGGRMIPSDEPTHLGWTLDFNFIVKE